MRKAPKNCASEIRVKLLFSTSARNIYTVPIKRANCTVVQALRLCTGRTAHRRSRRIALLFLDHGTRRG